MLYLVVLKEIIRPWRMYADISAILVLGGEGQKFVYTPAVSRATLKANCI